MEVLPPLALHGVRSSEVPWPLGLNLQFPSSFFSPFFSLLRFSVSADLGEYRIIHPNLNALGYPQNPRTIYDIKFIERPRVATLRSYAPDLNQSTGARADFFFSANCFASDRDQLIKQPREAKPENWQYRQKTTDHMVVPIQASFTQDTEC